MCQEGRERKSSEFRLMDNTKTQDDRTGYENCVTSQQLHSIPHFDSLTEVHAPGYIL